MPSSKAPKNNGGKTPRGRRRKQRVDSGGKRSKTPAGALVASRRKERAVTSPKAKRRAKTPAASPHKTDKSSRKSRRDKRAVKGVPDSLRKLHGTSNKVSHASTLATATRRSRKSTGHRKNTPSTSSSHPSLAQQPRKHSPPRRKSMHHDAHSKQQGKGGRQKKKKQPEEQEKPKVEFAKTALDTDSDDDDNDDADDKEMKTEVVSEKELFGSRDPMRNRARTTPYKSKSTSVRKLTVNQEDKHKMDELRKELQKEELRVMSEEAAEWMASALDKDYGDPMLDNFWESLQTGTDLCRLVDLCTAPDDKVVRMIYKKNAKKGTFFARDNIANALQGMKEIGVKEITIFETEDIVSRKNDKRVIRSLLALARIAARNGSGVKPPLIIQYEMEIDALIAEAKAQGPDDDDDLEELEDVQPAQPEPDEDTQQGDEQDQQDDAKEEDPFRKCRWLPYLPKKGDDLDEAVALAVNVNRIDVRIRKGKRPGEYRIGRPPNVFLRLIRKLVLVRIGGGWQGFVRFARQKHQQEREDRSIRAARKQSDILERNKNVFSEVGKDVLDGGALLDKTIQDIQTENDMADMKNAYEQEKK